MEKPPFSSLIICRFRPIFFNLYRVVGPYTLSNLCERLYANIFGKIRLLKGSLI
jgi:hypothetical protein